MNNSKMKKISNHTGRPKYYICRRGYNTIPIREYANGSVRLSTEELEQIKNVNPILYAQLLENREQRRLYQIRYRVKRKELDEEFEATIKEARKTLTDEEIEMILSGIVTKSKIKNNTDTGEST